MHYRLQYWAAVCLLLAGSLLPVRMVRAASACEATITPGTVQPGGVVSFNINIHNNGGPSFNWVDVTVPASNFAYTGNSVNSWFADDKSNGATFVGGSIANGGSANFGVSAQVGPGTSSGEVWTVRVSNSMFGDNPIACEGSVTTVIEGHPPNETGSGISNVAVAGITKNSATVTWTSDQPTSSVVYYGTTDNYGSSTSPDPNLVTSHSVTLTGLSADTTYHFQAAGFRSNGTFDYSSDGTFTTLPAPVMSSGGSSGTTTTTTKPATASTPTTTTTVNPHAVGDKIPPTLTLATKLTGAYKTPPLLTGSAADDTAVSLVEYSLDAGKNWLPAEVMQGKGTKSATFELHLPPLQDGNYDMVVRAVDSSDNKVTLAGQTLVIDQLPPLVGASVVAVGPQIVYLDKAGIITALQGTDQKVTMSAVGGPIAITLNATSVDKGKTTSTFSLRKSQGSGLWTGAMNFVRAGDYDITAQALDGAGNITKRPLMRVHVVPRAPVMEAGTNKIIKAKVTVFYRDPETQSWTLWDGAPYAQQNPQTTDNGRNYGFYLPQGTYYLRYDAPGYKTVVSRSVTIDQPTALTEDMYLSHTPGIYKGKLRLSIPWISLAQTNYSQSVTSKVRTSQQAMPKVPNFKLPQTSQQALSYTDLWGKPTVLTLMNSWAPSSQDQLAILAKFDNPDIRIVPVSSGDSLSRTVVYAKLSGYPAPMVVDSNNQLAQDMSVAMVPTHYFLDRHGLVKKIMVGVLSKEEILQHAQN